VSDYLGRALLVPVLRELIEQQPRLRFEIATTHSREGARLVGLGEVDCAVVTGLEAPRGVEAERLFEQAFVWIGPRRGRARPPLPDRLAREPLLRLGAGSQGRRLLEDYLARERIQPVSTIDVPSVSLLLAYVSSGLGIGLAPALALAEIDRERVRWERADVPALSVALLYRPGFRRGAAGDRFATRLVAEGRHVGERLTRAVPAMGGRAATRARRGTRGTST
jgi:DNA-binding transcriptional LysR family regulator